LVVFVSVPLILPAPLAAIPVTLTLLSLVQFKTDPGTLLLFTIVVIDDPEQMVCADGTAVATGNGFTVAVTGTLGAETQLWETAYSNSTLEMKVPAPNSLHISCGGLVDIGNCMPRRCI
jgi:hypothetical protein